MEVGLRWKMASEKWHLFEGPSTSFPAIVERFRKCKGKGDNENTFVL